jgi:hypothetical protein
MRPCGAGYEKTQSAQAPLWVFVSATFFCAGKTASQFLYRNPRNVVYNFYVMRNTIWLHLYEKYLTNDNFKKGTFKNSFSRQNFR